MSFEEGSPVPGAADTGSVSERSAQRGAIATPRTPRQWNAGDEEPQGDVKLFHERHGFVERRRGGWLFVRMPDGTPYPEELHGQPGWAWEANQHWPLSEVLPETPEPPREDEDLFPSALAEHCYFEGCQEWITGSSDYCPEHAKLYAPVPASQSVPAVPVSSTGGKETEEAAEKSELDGESACEHGTAAGTYCWPCAQHDRGVQLAAYAAPVPPSPLPAVGPHPSREELGHRIREVWVRWAREQADPKASWLLPWEDLDDGQREVDMRMGEALFGLGMTWSPVPSPLPDSETETEHVIEFREDGWTIMHPLACRPNLSACAVNRAAGHALQEPPAEFGRFACGLAEDGQFVVGDRRGVTS